MGASRTTTFRYRRRRAGYRRYSRRRLPSSHNLPPPTGPSPPPPTALRHLLRMVSPLPQHLVRAPSSGTASRPSRLPARRRASRNPLLIKHYHRLVRSRGRRASRPDTTLPALSYPIRPRERLQRGHRRGRAQGQGKQGRWISGHGQIWTRSSERALGGALVDWGFVSLACRLLRNFTTDVGRHFAGARKRRSGARKCHPLARDRPANGVYSLNSNLLVSPLHLGRPPAPLCSSFASTSPPLAPDSEPGGEVGLSST